MRRVSIGSGFAALLKYRAWQNESEAAPLREHPAGESFGNRGGGLKGVRVLTV